MKGWKQETTSWMKKCRNPSTALIYPVHPLNEQRERSVNKAFNNSSQEEAQCKCVCNEALALNSIPEP